MSKPVHDGSLVDEIIQLKTPTGIDLLGRRSDSLYLERVLIESSQLITHGIKGPLKGSRRRTTPRVRRGRVGDQFIDLTHSIGD
jgi:hypothetical protein